MRKEDMVFNLDGKLPNDELFDVSEYVFAITKKDWICGTDYNPNIQLVALYEIIDRSEYDLMDEKDNPDFPIIVETSIFAHPKFFSKKFMDSFAEKDVIDDNDGKYPICYALYDAYMYMGGIHVNPETVQGAHTCDIESEVVVNNGKFRHFKTFEDAEKYIKEIYVPNTDAIMGLIGFYLDRPWNQLGTNGWDSIYTMTQGKDLFKPAFDRIKEELKGNKEEDDTE
jgi:hypothetical protein